MTQEAALNTEQSNAGQARSRGRRRQFHAARIGCDIDCMGFTLWKRPRRGGYRWLAYLVLCGAVAWSGMASGSLAEVAAAVGRLPILM